MVDRPQQLHKVKLRIVGSGVCDYLNRRARPTVEPDMVCALGTISHTGVCQVSTTHGHGTTER